MGQHSELKDLRFALMESIVHHRTLKITTIFFYLCFNFKPIFPFPLNSYCSTLFLRVLNKYCFLSYSIWFCMQPLPILHVFALVETVTCHSQELGSQIDLDPNSVLSFYSYDLWQVNSLKSQLLSFLNRKDSSPRFLWDVRNEAFGAAVGTRYSKKAW